MPISHSESLLLFTPWNQLNFDVTASKTHRTLATIEVAIFTLNWNVQYSAEVLNLLHQRLSRASPRRLNDATRQSSVFNAKTRSSVPFAQLNRHYQCTHEFSRVSGHFTHCWAYRHVELTGCQSQ